MTLHQRLLTGILLILTGMLAGALLIIFRGGIQPFIPTEVQITEVRRSTGGPVEVSGASGGFGSFSVRDVAREVVPTVVYIETQMSARNMVPNDGNHDFGDDFWDRLMPRNRANAIGSGVLISADGFILTNNHVIAGSRDVRVTLSDKRQFEAKVVGRDPSTDLAVLKIDGNDLPFITLGDSDYVEVGDWVIAVGNPLRLRSTITAGIVSALGRDVQIINDRMRIENFIQTDAAINKGNSGGALVNQAGELIGINTAIATESGMNQGYGFAIPINMAFKIGRDIMEFGEVQRAFLGVQIAEVNQRRARELGLDSIRGVEINSVVPLAAADQSGLKAGDIVYTINKHDVNEPNQLQAQVALFRPGQTIDVTVWRNGNIMNIPVTLQGLESEAISEWQRNDSIQNFEFDFYNHDDDTPEQGEDEEESMNDENLTEDDFLIPLDPEEDSSEAESAEPASMRFDLGFEVNRAEVEINNRIGIQYQVSQVRRLTRARRAGLQEGDTILGVDGQRVESLSHLSFMIEQAELDRGPELMILRSNEVFTIDMRR
ncbi:MAG: trypsin-like peptidase domain-containing protein [Balneolales bacterium]|nr:trypsin-like peptidase domain-containing protein [Balneolales bacterium]